MFQIAIIPLNDDLYWSLYDTSTDVMELMMSLALFNAVSYRNVATKTISGALTVWCTYVIVSNAVTDYWIDGSINTSWLCGAFASASIFIVFCCRYGIRLDGSSVEPQPGKFYIVRGKPKNIQQLIVAAYTGEAGSFGITDGRHLWHYSKDHCALIREPLAAWQLNRKVCTEIKRTERSPTTRHCYDDLDRITGHEFSLVQNCLELRRLAYSWGDCNG